MVSPEILLSFLHFLVIFLFWFDDGFDDNVVDTNQAYLSSISLLAPLPIEAWHNGCNGRK